MTRMSPLVRLVVMAVALMASIAAADAQTLDGQNITVTLLQTPYSPAIDTVTAGSGGPQIVGGDSSAIGGILFAGNPGQQSESIDLQGLSIVAVLEGGGGSYMGSESACSGAPGCSYWAGATSDARYEFSGLSFGTPNTVLTGVDIRASNIFGVPTVMDLTPTSFVVEFGAAGILNGTNGNLAISTLTMDLQTGVSAVPEPSTYALMLAGLLVVMWQARARFRGSNI
jgi:PEP-CTERM motif